MEITIRPAKSINATITVPGDKSISHRALMLGAIAQGRTVIKNLSPAVDCQSTIRCLRQLGIAIARADQHTVTVDGCGLHGLSEPKNVLDAGNSGTTARLLCGILAGQPFLSIITGDDSLRSRPMDRILRPLTQMGALALARGDDRLLPLAIRGGHLQPISYRPPVPSAQVKSAILLAALYATGQTIIDEPKPTRDHTERMLQAMGIPLRKHGNIITVDGSREPSSIRIVVPGDISSASFFLAAAAIVPNSSITVPNVGINPTRTGFLDALRTMGASLTISNTREASNEPVADVTCTTSSLRSITLEGDAIPRLIDEIPIIAVLATQAEGVTIIRNAEELRVKESDRIAGIASELSRLGAKIKPTPDGFIIEGPTPLRGARCQSYNDHRIAMALAIAGLVAKSETTIDDADCVDISFPGFFQLLDQVRKGA